MTVVHELIMLKSITGKHHLYLRTGDQYRHLVSRRQESKVLLLYKEWRRTSTINQTRMYLSARQWSDAFPEEHTIIRSTYLTFPIVIEPEKPNDPTQLSSQDNT